jgi:hypothetical protein
MIDISNYFGSLAALASLTVIISGYINTHIFSLGSSTLKQVVSWVVAILVCVVGSLKGLVVDTSVLWTIVNGLAVGLVANGIFDVSIVQSILEFIKAKPTK